MKKSAPLFLVLSLAVFGAGCAPKTTTTTEPYATTPPDAYANAQPSESTPAPAETNDVSSSTDSSVTTPSAMTNEALAFPGILPAAETANKIVRIKTNKGEIVFELLPQEGPKAASNFVYLANKKFYDGLTFHRVESNFVIQGGDPLGNGMGGPGYSFEDDPVKLPYNKGIVAMANAGKNTNGSQFFIMLEDTPLKPDYSIFGRVIAGQDVVSKIAVGDVMSMVSVEDKK